jgi:hypothetical protein
MAGDRTCGCVLGLIVLGTGCGPSVVAPENNGSDATTSTEPSTDDGVADATSAPDATGQPTTAGPGTGSSESGQAADETAAADSSTGETWLFAPGSSYSWLSCDERTNATTLLIELYWDPPPTECVPSPKVDLRGLVFLGVLDWDGNGGTFAAGPDGPVSGSAGLAEMIVGTVELTVSAPFVPDTIALDLQTEDGQTIVGLADLGTCFRPPETPCK